VLLMPIFRKYPSAKISPLVRNLTYLEVSTHFLHSASLVDSMPHDSKNLELFLSESLSFATHRKLNTLAEIRSISTIVKGIPSSSFVIFGPGLLYHLLFQVYPRMSHRIKLWLKILIALRSKSISVIYPMFDIATPVFSSALLLAQFFCRVICIPLGNTKREAEACGFIHVSRPIVFLWTLKRLSEQQTISNRQRPIFSSLSFRGSSHRIELMSIIKQEVLQIGGNVYESGKVVRYDDHFSIISRCFLYVSTNETQGFFWRGPIRKFVSKENTTGRNWEAFAAGCLLLTNETEALRGFGFRKGEHYLTLPAPESLRSLIRKIYQNPRQYEGIARNGHQRFVQVLHDQVGTFWQGVVTTLTE